MARAACFAARTTRDPQFDGVFLNPMLLLAVDTSGKHGSIALARCGPGDSCEVIAIVPLTGGTFSAQLVPQIAALLSAHGFDKHDLDAFAAASGPGSFTGLRVGLAAIKALAEILEKPIAAVSLLEAVAEAGSPRGKTVAVLDAGRGEVFAAVNEGTNASHEHLLTREELFASEGDALIITPDATIAEAARTAGLQVEEIERPRSDAIARLGWKKILVGQTVSAETLDANYVRRSDAEIFFKRGH
jgi:tRNA threonylcarbamoyladenosine biosynthesis protein TsaB